MCPTDQASISVKIVERKPCARYRGVTYDQTVIAETDSGQRLSLFDYTPMLVQEDMVNSWKDTTISILPEKNFDANPGKSYGIYEPPYPVGDWSHDFVGSVTHIGEDRFVMDVGDGTVRIGRTEYTDTFFRERSVVVGDELSVTAVRTDLVAIQ